ncbi:kinase-like domain-containing protein [Nemania serpens]|nr:kinase-like domain-containing protein [Nemania serpens]
MKICELSDAYLAACEEPTFDHTKIILQRGDDEYFYAKSSQRIYSEEEVNIEALDMTEIPLEHIWPLADPKFTRAPEPLPANCYLKRQRLLTYEASPSAHKFGDQTLVEAEACEVLRKHPHPNIVKYLGCVVKNSRIEALAFDRYTINLHDVIVNDISFDKSRCMNGIEAGVRHMHDLGLVHNDLNPGNIMMDGDNPVIIDFDSCKPEGERLGMKGGTYGYSLDEEEYSKRSNDLYSLSKMRESVMEGKIFNQLC